MILTRTREEAEAAWDRREVRKPYRSRNDFLRFCAAVQADCRRLGLTPFGSSAKIEEIAT